MRPPKPSTCLPPLPPRFPRPPPTSTATVLSCKMAAWSFERGRRTCWPSPTPLSPAPEAALLHSHQPRPPRNPVPQGRHDNYHVNSHRAPTQLPSRCQTHTSQRAPFTIGMAHCTLSGPPALAPPLRFSLTIPPVPLYHQDDSSSFFSTPFARGRSTRLAC